VSPDLLLKGAILGLVEGATEFIPVSSTGHLIVVSNWLGLVDERAKTFDVFIQLGAILAIVWLYRVRLWRAVVAARHEAASRRFLINLFVAFLPAASVGLLSHHWIETHLFNPRTVAVASIVGGLIIMAVEAMQKEARVTQLEQIGVKMAWWVGVAQCVALIPGTSRSGATIIGALLAGMDRKTATEYSFFLALPTLLAATGYKLAKSAALFSAQDLLALGLGLIVAFLVAWAVIAGFLNFVKRHSLFVFAYYRIAMGLLVLWIMP